MKRFLISSGQLLVVSTGFLLSGHAFGETGSDVEGSETVKSEKSVVSFDGVLMLDASQYDGVYGDGEAQTETQVRRATLGLTATIFQNAELEVSAKFEDGLNEAELKDALLGWEMANSQKLKIGRQKEPVGMENNQSSKQIPAIERSMASSLFTPKRNTGLVYSSKKSRYSVAFGVFEADHDIDYTGLAFSGRTTAALIKNRFQTLHIGASASQRDLGGTSLKLKDEGGVNSAENIISSSRLDVDSTQTVALEAAWLQGPMTLQTEWFQHNLQLAENESAKDPDYSGGYIQGSWLIGKARRKYKNGSMKLSGLKGATAWEAVLRAGKADLEDAEGGSQADTMMLGVNYYHGEHFRIMAGLTQTNTTGSDADDSNGNAGTVRLQYVF